MSDLLRFSLTSDFRYVIRIIIFNLSLFFVLVYSGSRPCTISFSTSLLSLLLLPLFFLSFTPLFIFFFPFLVFFSFSFSLRYIINIFTFILRPFFLPRVYSFLACVLICFESRLSFPSILLSDVCFLERDVSVRLYKNASSFSSFCISLKRRVVVL